MFFPSFFIAELIKQVEDRKAHEAWIATLPPEKQAEVRAEDKRQEEIRAEHRRKLEIAEAGRPRNFWGK